MNIFYKNSDKKV